jgi:hypothetical protein
MAFKKYLLLFIFCLFLVSCNRKQLALFEYPPNTKPLVNGKYLDVSYIECLHILEFLYSLKKDPSSQGLYNQLVPKTDSLRFGQFSLNYTDYRFRFYPMPVSKELAIEYCKWRGEVVTHLKNFGQMHPSPLYSDIIRQNKDAKFIIKYSIPTTEELGVPYKHKTTFKKYDQGFMFYDVLNQESNDTTKLYFLRCIATAE